MTCSVGVIQYPIRVEYFLDDEMMKSKFAKTGALLLALLGAPLLANASDGTITFTGTLSASTCTINGGSSSFSVALPTISISSLAAANATAGATPFSIKLTGCSGSSTTTAAFFESGNSIDPAVGRLKNMASGGAGNVEIQLLNSDNTVIDLSKAAGGQGVSSAPISGNSSTSNFIARYFATAATTAGAVSSTVNYSITYN